MAIFTVVNAVFTQFIWIGGDAYTAVAIAKKEGSGSWTVYNIFRDHLGTIAHLKNATTGVVNNYSFDACSVKLGFCERSETKAIVELIPISEAVREGRRRDADNWTYTLTEEASLFADRGFTGHEYLADFDLYNMNGRLYDPVVGRFLSPDPLIQSPDYTQSYNRYSYALNNPLKYNDPSGYNVQPTTYQEEIPWVYRPFGGGGGGSPYRMSPTGRYYMMPGRGGNGPGSNGNYYDWYSGTYRSTSGDNDQVSWGSVNGSISPYFSKTYTFSTQVVSVLTGHYYHDGNGIPIEIDGTMGYFEQDWIEKTIIEEAAGQGGEPLPSWLSWINNFVNAGAYGAYEVGGSMRFMKAGSLSLKYYASAWTGGSRAKIATFNLSKLGTGIGYGTSFVGAGIGITNFILSDKQHWSDYGKLGVSLTSATLTCFPATTGLGIGLGVADTAGGLNGFYNYLDTNQQLYNSTGLIMIPNNMGVPMFLNLK